MAAYEAGSRSTPAPTAGGSAGTATSPARSRQCARIGMPADDALGAASAGGPASGSGGRRPRPRARRRTSSSTTATRWTTCRCCARRRRRAAGPGGVSRLDDLDAGPGRSGRVMEPICGATGDAMGWGHEHRRPSTATHPSACTWSPDRSSCAASPTTASWSSCDWLEAGIHDPDGMPFSFPWIDVTPAEQLGRNIAAVPLAARGRLLARDFWVLNLGVWSTAGSSASRGSTAKHFSVTRTGETGSWLGASTRAAGSAR